MASKKTKKSSRQKTNEHVKSDIGSKSTEELKKDQQACPSGLDLASGAAIDPLLAGLFEKSVCLLC